MELSKEDQIKVLEATLRTFKKTLKEKKGVLHNPYYLCGIVANEIKLGVNSFNISKFIPSFNFQNAEELAKKYKFKKPSYKNNYWWTLEDPFGDNGFLIKEEPPRKIDIVNRKRFLSCLIKELKTKI